MEPNMKANTLTVKSRVQASLVGKMDLLTTEDSTTTISMEKALTDGPIKDSLKVTGKTIKCMEKVSSLGMMVEHIKEIMKMIRNTVMVFSNGQTEEAIKVNGKTANNTAKAGTKVAKAKKNTEDGKKEKE